MGYLAVAVFVDGGLEVVGHVEGVADDGGVVADGIAWAVVPEEDDEALGGVGEEDADSGVCGEFLVDEARLGGGEEEVVVVEGGEDEGLVVLHGEDAGADDDGLLAVELDRAGGDLGQVQSHVYNDHSSRYFAPGSGSRRGTGAAPSSRTSRRSPGTPPAGGTTP